MKNIKFGISIGRYWGYEFIQKAALYAEEHDFDCIWFPDHVLPPPYLSKDRLSLDAWVTMAAIASMTESIKIGIVNCNPFRHPSILAKIAATFDVISGGRLEFCIGAGGNKDENEAYGIPFPNLSTRIDWLRESIKIIRGLWTEKSFTFEGSFYRVKDAYCEPKPVQKPNPAIWIGGRSNKLLQVVAEHGDGCNFLWMTAEEYTSRIATMEHYCDQVGRQLENIKRSYCTDVILAQNKALLDKKFVKLKNGNIRGIKAQRMNLRDYSRRRFVGTPQNCIDLINEFVEIGVSEFMLVFPEMDEFDLTCLRFFAEHVIPSFN